jgi:hypothetical protein
MGPPAIESAPPSRRPSDRLGLGAMPLPSWRIPSLATCPSRLCCSRPMPCLDALQGGRPCPTWASGAHRAASWIELGGEALSRGYRVDPPMSV